MADIPTPSWIQDLADRTFDTVEPGADPVVVGLCGPQGSGKTTASRHLAACLRARGLRTVVLSLDDLYLSKADRRGLARTVHPLLATRGPPGTHDPLLGMQTLKSLQRCGATALPRFDKATDDRVQSNDWPLVDGPMSCIIFEGWCVGAVAQPDRDIAYPVNELEATEDADLRWRRYVNASLAGPYQLLFDWVDLQVLLRPPSFDQVLAWRSEQEHQLRASGRTGEGVMDDAAVARFIQHYERLSRWIDTEMPQRADLVIELNASRIEIGRISR